MAWPRAVSPTETSQVGLMESAQRNPLPSCHLTNSYPGLGIAVNESFHRKTEIPPLLGVESLACRDSDHTSIDMILISMCRRSSSLQGKGFKTKSLAPASIKLSWISFAERPHMTLLMPFRRIACAVSVPSNCLLVLATAGLKEMRGQITIIRMD